MTRESDYLELANTPNFADVDIVARSQVGLIFGALLCRAVQNIVAMRVPHATCSFCQSTWEPSSVDLMRGKSPDTINRATSINLACTCSNCGAQQLFSAYALLDANDLETWESACVLVAIYMMGEHERGELEVNSTPEPDVIEAARRLASRDEQLAGWVELVEKVIQISIDHQ